MPSATEVDFVSVLVEAEPLIKDRYSRMLSSISYRFDTDDLYQVVCQRAYRSQTRCNGKTSSEIRNWIMKIAANACRTAITAHKVSKIRSTRVEKLAVGVSSEEENSIDPSDGVDLATREAVKAQCGHMLACLDRLPKQRQQILRLRYLRGMSYEDIAREMGITECAARTSASQALIAARAEMSQFSLPGFE